MTTPLTTAAEMPSSGQRMASYSRRHRARLKAGMEKHQAVDQVHQDLPEEDALKTGRRADDVQAFQLTYRPAVTVASTPEPPRCSGGQNAMNGREDREQDFDLRVAHPAPQAQHQPAHADAPYDFSGHDGGKHCRRLAERKRSGAHGRDRKAIKNQRRRVIGQALPFEDDQDSPGSCILRAIDSGASASGGETIAPRNEPHGQDRPRIQCAAAAAVMVVKATKPMASSEMGAD